jgi:hypothetical protein
LDANVRIPGDVNGDGVVNLLDFYALLKDLNKRVDVSVCGPACDLDGDERITLRDARQLLRIYSHRGSAE